MNSRVLLMGCRVLCVARGVCFDGIEGLFDGIEGCIGLFDEE